MSKNLKGIILVLINLVMIWIMTNTGNPLKTGTTALGILNLELAFDKNITNTIIQYWNQQQLISIAKKNTYYDFIFLWTYTALFYFLCRQTAKQFRINSFSWKMSFLLSSAAIIAGLMDILENIGMLFSLSGYISQGTTLFTFSASIFKWCLVAGIIAWLIIASFLLVFRWLAKKEQN